MKVEQVSTLEELNYFFEVWLKAHYLREPHGGIKEYYESLGAEVPEEGISPQFEWDRDTRKLNKVDVSVIAEAFLHHETRKVYKDGSLSLKGTKYAAGVALSGQRVEVIYDPTDLSTVMVSYQGSDPVRIGPMRIGETCGVVEKAESQVPAEGSRYLRVLEKEYKELQHPLANVISFSSYQKEDN